MVDLVDAINTNIHILYRTAEYNQEPEKKNQRVKISCSKVSFSLYMIDILLYSYCFDTIIPEINGVSY